MATKCIIHGWDAKTAFDPRPRIPADRAVAATEETLRVLVPTTIANGWRVPEETLEVVITDTDDRWVLAPTPDGVAFDLDATPGVTLEGTADAICLFLQGRGDDLAEDLDPEKWRSWRRLVTGYTSF